MLLLHYLKRLVESSPDIIIAVDRQGTIIFYNDGARKNLGFAPEDIIGQKVTRVYPSAEEVGSPGTELEFAL